MSIHINRSNRMRDIHITVINYDWEKSYPIDSISSLNVGHLKDILRAENETFRSQNQIVIYKGATIPSDEILLSDIVVEEFDDSIVFQIYMVDPDICLPEGFSYAFDPLSVIAAKEFIAEDEYSICSESFPCFSQSSCCHQRKVNSSPLKRIVDSLSTGMLHSVVHRRFTLNWYVVFLDEYSPQLPCLYRLYVSTYYFITPDIYMDNTAVYDATYPADETLAGPAEAPAAVAGPQQQPPPLQRPAPLVLPQVEWLQWGVIVKLAITCFLFTYNRNVSNERLATTIGTPSVE
jgi:hypothetical protein